MAELVGAFATSHTPVMLNFPDAVSASERDTVYGHFRKIGQALAAVRPDTVIVVSDDHLHHFFLDNFPAFCIGAGDAYPAPAEHWLRAQRQVLQGDPTLGAHLLGEALAADFDPAFSMRLTLDHGVLTPLVLAEMASRVKLVPLLINCVQPPMPKMSRCLQWGHFLGRAIRSYPGKARIAILATGGISHDVATPRMGMVNETFDREFLRLLGSGDNDAVVRYATDHVNEAGNGAEEIRNWLVAHGAAENARFHVHFYQAMPQWYTGIALVEWQING